MTHKRAITTPSLIEALPSWRKMRVAAFFLAFVTETAFACTRVHDFRIPAQPLDKALIEFARQAGVSALFPSKDFRDVTVNRVAGEYCPEDALLLLLRGSGIDGHIDETGQVVIKRPERELVQEASTEAQSAGGADAPEEGKGLVGAVLHALFGEAERAERPARQETRPEEIMVTGSRIKRSGMETPTPVTQLKAQEIAVLAPGHFVEAMNQLPQFLGNSGPSTVGSATGPLGSSFLNLRGMGANRTLVLLDGRRVVSSNRLGVPDIAMLPEAVISGVEIVTGGASAAYGSDAVSGVVNYVLDTDFSGLKGHAQGGLTSRGDNERLEWSLSMGRDLGRGLHVLAAMDYFEVEKVESYAERSWYKGWGTVDVPGSDTLVVAPDVRSRLYTAGGLIRLPGSALDMIHFTEGGRPEAFEDGTLVGYTRQSGGTGYHSQAASKEEDLGGLGSLYPNTRRGSLFLYLDQDFGTGWNSFFQFIRGYNEIDYASTGAHQELSPWRATIFRDNAFLPASVARVMDEEERESFPLYRYASNLDLNRARGGQDNEASSYTLGLRGSAGRLHLDAFYQFSSSESVYRTIDFPRLDRLYRAMDAVLDPATGGTVCRSTLSFPDDGCIPANPFGAGTMSREAVDYILEGDMYRSSELDQHFAEITAEMELLPGRSPAPIAVAGGLSYREDDFLQTNGPQHMLDLSVPAASEAGYRGLPPGFVGPHVLQFSGIGDLPLGGGFHVWELFGEAYVPLVRGRGIFQALDASVAWRFADYSGSGLVSAWKTGLDWRVNEALRFRLTRSRDTRAATLAERYDRTGGGGAAYDPERGAIATFSRLAGGNPDVEPELADTWTAGVVLQPDFAPDMALSLDWYDVSIKDYITQLGVQPIIDGCHEGNQALCRWVTRSSRTGEIVTVYDFYLNMARARVRGLDLELSWQRPLSLFTRGGEALHLRLFASHMTENSFATLGEQLRDKAGITEIPEWTATAMLGYEHERFRTTLSGRYIPGRVQFSEPVPSHFRLDNNGVDAVWYLNLRVDLPLGTSRNGAERTLYLDVANLLDRDPPVVANWSHFFGASAFVPWLHDALGRRFTLGVQFDF